MNMPRVPPAMTQSNKGCEEEEEEEGEEWASDGNLFSSLSGLMNTTLLDDGFLERDDDFIARQYASDVLKVCSMEPSSSVELARMSLASPLQLKLNFK
jgi:hypothetical protein